MTPLLAQVEADGFLQAELRVERAGAGMSGPAGRVVMVRPVVLDPGTNVFKFRVSELPAGVYFIKVKSDAGMDVFTVQVHCSCVCANVVIPIRSPQPALRPSSISSVESPISGWGRALQTWLAETNRS